MAEGSIRAYPAQEGIPLNGAFQVHARSVASSTEIAIPAYAVDLAEANTTRDAFDRHTAALASFDLEADAGPVEVTVKYEAEPIKSAVVRPLSLGIEAQTLEDGKTICFVLSKPRDVMLEINDDKWQALHLLSNVIDPAAPTADTDDVWYFGPGINQGAAYEQVKDGVNLFVPSGKTVYLASGAFVTCRINFVDVTNAGVRGQGFILGPEGGYEYREHGGAIHMSRASNIFVGGVTSVGANGFSLSAGECRNVHVDGYRSFSFAGNGDGVDFFCSSDITIENCFLRNSDDTIALYSHRWNWYGDSDNITIRNCVLLPDIAHPINMGTHGNPDKPETTSNVHISNIDILDHNENQLWYQGCIAINAADENTFRNIHVSDVRVEKITRGQLVNIRVMKNNMWTTAPGKSIENVTFKNLSLNLANSKIVNPSQILGYDKERRIENVTFENLTVDGKVVHDGMDKPRWYMVSDLIPLFANEHVGGLKFIE